MSVDVNRLGFDLARMLRDPQFRQRLTAAGHDGQPIVPLPQDSRIGDLLARIDDYDRPVLLAVADSTCPQGWRLVWWDERARTVEQADLDQPAPWDTYGQPSE